jgi:hypothetical protein
MRKSTLFILIFFSMYELYADTTHIAYLSGRGKDNTVNWEFYCTKGRKSGYWTTIPVPSCWEQEGFGSYNYGGDPNANKANEQGLYHYSFNTLNDWQGKHIFLVFDGSMTDTEVKINGQSAGDIHQGAFYRFQYEITNLVRYDSINTLEATVSKMSSNYSVNQAERKSDYWVFGGIYRPVYLKIVPAEFIERTAINAKADGSFLIDVYLQNINTADLVEAQIEDINGVPVGLVLSQTITSGQNKVTLQTVVTNPQTWSAETPNLYLVSVVLKQGSTEIHRVKERFGFRTIEVRVGDGIYINGKKIVMKGTNRHSFHPKTGRTLNDSLSFADVELLQEMNMNAVRMSHYPPDVHFLDACDEKGIYVLDELAGWQAAYDTQVGEKLVREMIIRDVNHPSIVFWDNGNEGGWNTALDDDFLLWDPQSRKVLHPWALFNGIDTDHYENYSSTTNKLNGPNIFMTTEFLHGLYDGGQGAGLNDYWKLMMSRPKSAGGFTWAFIDEGVERTDWGNAIDVVGSNAPDGILGPYREKEGSFYTIKEIWSPVYIDLDSLPTAFTGTIPVQNRYSFINLNQCAFNWKLVDFYKPGQSATGYQIKKSGTVTAPSVAPGSSDTLRLNLPNDWHLYDALYLTVKDHTNREVYTYTWPIRKAGEHREQIVTLENGTVTMNEDTSYITINANECEFKFDKKNGNLASVKRQGNPFTFSQGPALCSGTQTLNTITSRQEGNDYIVEATYSGNIAYALWRINASGWVQLQYKYSLSGEYDYMGVSFSYPISKMRGITWLGRGPYRVYKNRMRGVTFNVWQKDFNNTVTGSSLWQYPEFEGYHSNVYWAVMETTEGQITIVSEDERLFLRLYSPPAPTDPRNTIVAYPKGDISFLDGIPPVGDKFITAAQNGPEGQKNTASGDYSRTLYFFFGNGTTEVKECFQQIPRNFSLDQNYPNPFNPSTTIKYQVGEAQLTTLKIYDLLGREVAILVNKVKPPGIYEVQWNATTMPSGVYFYRLQAGSHAKTKMMTLLK